MKKFLLILPFTLLACTESPQADWTYPQISQNETTSITQFRTIKNRQSISADCILEVQDIKAQFQTPANIKLPASVDGKLSPVIVTCQSDGITRTEILAPRADQSYRRFHAQDLPNNLEISNIVGSTQYSHAQATPSSLASIALSTNVVGVNQQYYPSRVDISFD